MHTEKESLVQRYLKQKDPQIREDIVEAYTPLVEYIARKLAFQRDDIPDLIQVGSMGLLKSLNHFKPDKDIAFSTFASSNIIGEIKHYLRDKGRLVKLPRKLQEQYGRIRQYIKDTSQKDGKFPTVREIAKKLDMSEETVLESLEAGQITKVVSLDKPLYKPSARWNAQEQISLMDSLGIESRDESLLRKETLSQVINQLPSRQRKIIYYRFYDSLTQKEIAQRMGLSQMHISRLLVEAIDRLKEALGRPLEE